MTEVLYPELLTGATEIAPEDRVRYDLFILMHEEAVLSALFHHRDRIFTALESIPVMHGESPVTTFLDKFWNQSRLAVHSGFRSQWFISARTPQTLVPGPLFTPDAASSYLGFGNRLTESPVLLTDELNRAGARNIYAVHETVHQSLIARFPDIHFRHVTSELIESFLAAGRHVTTESIYAAVDGNALTLIVTSGPRLLLCNHFTFENPEGLIYFILFACEQLQLNPESVQLRFSGSIDEESPAYGLARKYIRDTALVTLPEGIERNDELAQLPAHRFYRLFLHARCVS